MKKLFKLTANWLIHHSEEYRSMSKVYVETLEEYQSMTKAYAETIQENQILSDKNQQLKIIIKNQENKLNEIEKIINRYNNAKDIKKCIKEVL